MFLPSFASKSPLPRMSGFSVLFVLSVSCVCPVRGSILGSCTGRQFLFSMPTVMSEVLHISCVDEQAPFFIVFATTNVTAVLKQPCAEHIERGD